MHSSTSHLPPTHRSPLFVRMHSPPLSLQHHGNHVPRDVRLQVPTCRFARPDGRCGLVRQEERKGASISLFRLPVTLDGCVRLASISSLVSRRTNPVMPLLANFADRPVVFFNPDFLTLRFCLLACFHSRRGSTTTRANRIAQPLGLESCPGVLTDGARVFVEPW